MNRAIGGARGDGAGQDVISEPARLKSRPTRGGRGFSPAVRPLPRRLIATLIIGLALLGGTTRAALRELTFKVPARGEALAKIAVTCEACAWDVAGSEAVVLTIALDGRYSQHLPIIRRGVNTYDVLLGPLEAGSHTIRIDQDSELTAPKLRGGQVKVGVIAIEMVPEKSDRHLAVSLAPMLHARPDTVGRFTDVPLYMWYETEPTARGTRYRYSVIFTNEDGGTPADRLMATWGRTTDIEYVYSVEVDTAGGILEEDMQGPKHEILPFRGQREGRHALLWVSTSNNMVLDSGATKVRYAPAPVAFDLRDRSREAIMDRHAWIYEVMAHELKREGKIVAKAAPGSGIIPDPRSFAYIEGCGALGGGALTFAIQLNGSQEWISTDRGITEFRIARDGCFRAAVPLPSGTAASAIRGLRVQGHTRPSDGDTPRSPVTNMRLTRVNRLFMLDERFRPGTSVARWAGRLDLTPDGPPQQIPLK